MKKYDYSKTFTFEGKRYRVYGDSLEEVIEKKALKLRDLQENRIVLNASTKVKDWVEIALPTYKPDISDASMDRIRMRIRCHILPAIGELPISSVKPVQCQQILNEQIGKSKSYITKVHQDLCFIFRTALENQLIVKDPAASLHRPAGYSNHRRAITDSERKHLLKVCDENTRLVPFLFMLYCGCRPAEALNILTTDIQIIDDIRALHIRGTKTQNADRYVPIPDQFADYLEQIRPDTFGLFATKLDGTMHTESSYVSLTKTLYRAMNLSMGCQVYRNKLLPPFPLAEDFTPYCLRHTYCTDLKKAGVPLGIAKDYMGHSDISTTANIYSHADNETFLQGALQMGITPKNGKKKIMGNH